MFEYLIDGHHLHLAATLLIESTPLPVRVEPGRSWVDVRNHRIDFTLVQEAKKPSARPRREAVETTGS